MKYEQEVKFKIVRKLKILKHVTVLQVKRSILKAKKKALLILKCAELEALIRTY